jgi:hypothetical protein
MADREWLTTLQGFFVAIVVAFAASLTAAVAGAHLILVLIIGIVVSLLGVGLTLLPGAHRRHGWEADCEWTGSGMLRFRLHSALSTPDPMMRASNLGRVKCRVHAPSGRYTESGSLFPVYGGWINVDYSHENFPDMPAPAVAGRYEFGFYEQRDDGAGSWRLIQRGSYDAATAPEIWN